MSVHRIYGFMQLGGGVMSLGGGAYEVSHELTNCAVALVTAIRIHWNL